MPVTTFTAAPSNGAPTLATFKAWATPISAFFATCSWVQQNDTGQVVWTATVLTCTSVSTGGGNAVYNFSSYTGPDPRIGMSFTFSTFSAGGNNVTATVTAKSGGTGGGSGSVTVVLSTQVTDTTGSGTTTALAAVPGTNSYVYEIWKTGDSVGFDVYVKIEYGTSTNGTTNQNLFISMGTGTNGAGTLLNGSTRFGASANTNTSATLGNCRMAGDSSRMHIMLWTGNGLGTTYKYIYTLERSYDNTGTAIGSYYTIAHISQSNASNKGVQQTLFPSGALTVNETAGWVCAMPNTATTGNVGSTTHTSPIFPCVGGIGNPMTGIMVYRNVDFADNVVVYVTIYGVQHTYITFQDANTGESNMAAAASCMVRYD